jgi:cytochrome d ubiquinol oxidase subunit II
VSAPSGLVDAVAGVALLALVLYAVTGGADFGAGLWDRLASGPRKAAQRQLIEHALAPIWETNHVWLIFVVVVLFSAFPVGFAAIGVGLYAPLSLALVGIVLRGAAFVFRQYGQGSEADARRWGRVFGAASVLAPFFLGTSLAAVSAGELRVGAAGVSAPLSAWLGLYPLAVGLFVVALFGYLAAIYLTVEARDVDLRNDFRRRALGAGVLCGLLSLLVRASASWQGARLSAALFGSSWSLAAQLAVAALALATLGALVGRRYRLARALAVAQVAAVVVGWGVAQHPYLIAPDLTLHAAASPAATLKVVLGAIALGAVLLVPALYWLLHVFKLRDPQGS